MVGELGIEELEQAVALLGGCKYSELVAQDLDAVVPSLMDESAVTVRRSDEAIDGCAIGGSAGGDGEQGAVGEGDAGELNDRDAEGSEIGAKPRGDAVRVIVAEGYDSAVDDCLDGKDDGVVG